MRCLTSFSSPARWRGAFALLAGLAILFIPVRSVLSQGLTPGATYTIAISKVNSNGTTTQVGTTTATADANGRVTFTLTGVPTTNSANFLLVQILDGSNQVIRQGIVPAPPPGGTSQIGVNPLANALTQALLQGLQAAGTDDPIMVGFAFIIMRTANITANEIVGIAQGGRNAILGPNGLVSFLQTHGISATQLAALRNSLVNNANQGAKDLGDFTAKIKDAVDNPAQAAKEQAEAGSFMGDIFIDAADAAGIPLMLFSAAFDAAGVVAENQPGLNPQSRGGILSENVAASMNQAIESFFTRLIIVQFLRAYRRALTILEGTQNQLQRFNTAAQAWAGASAKIDRDFSQFWEDPQAFMNNNPQYPDAQAVRNAIDQRFRQAFDQFIAAILSTDQEITQMRATVAQALGINPQQLPNEVGKFWDFNGVQKNWPIPQTVLYQFVANMLLAGGNLQYTRGNTPVPNNMDWLDPDGQGPQQPQRTDFMAMGIPQPFAALLGLQQDIEIIQHAYWNTFGAGQQPSLQQEQQAKLLLHQRLEAAMNRLTGTVNAGGTPLSNEQKRAFIRVMRAPDIHG